jgi:hypothetical protein
MTDDGSGSTAAPQGGAPKMAGKVIIPDMSPMGTGQMANVQMMANVTENAASTLKSILAAQQTMLSSSVQNMQQALQTSAGNATIPSNSVPDVTVQLGNMDALAAQFSQTATTLTGSTTKSYDDLSKAVAESMAKIEEVATKFSGG